MSTQFKMVLVMFVVQMAALLLIGPRDLGVAFGVGMAGSFAVALAYKVLKM